MKKFLSLENSGKTSENTLREFPLVIATVAKVSCKRGLWLVVRVNKNFLFEKKVGFPESFNMFSPGRRPSFIISCANCRYSISLIALSRTSLS